MRFMMMQKNDAAAEAGTMPSQKTIEEMGALFQDCAKAGKFVEAAGLYPSSYRTRLVFRGGVSTAKRGPYRGERELPASILMLKLDSQDDAIGWAERYGKIVGDAEIEVAKVAMPPGEAQLYALVDKADAATEAGGRPAPVKTALSRLKTEMTKAGVLFCNVDLASSATSKRVRLASGKMHVTTGPFTESVELIGGFTILDLADVDEAVAFCRRLAAIGGKDLEIDVHVVERFETT